MKECEELLIIKFIYRWIVPLRQIAIPQLRYGQLAERIESKWEIGQEDEEKGMLLSRLVTLKSNGTLMVTL